MGFAKDLVVEAGSGNYLKTPPGTTKVRIIGEPVKFWKDFENKQQYLTEEAAKVNANAKPRYAMWVIDRADAVVKMWECSGGMVRDLQALSENPEYAFEGEFPYDVIITRVGTTQNDTRYSVQAARQNTTLTADEAKAVAAQQGMKDFLREDAADKNEVAPGFLA